MGMLNHEDLRQIGDVMEGKLKVFKTEIVDEIVGQVGEMIEFNVLPQFDEVKADIKVLQNTVATLPTKEYLDEKLGEVRSDFNLARRGAVI